MLNGSPVRVPVAGHGWVDATYTVPNLSGPSLSVLMHVQPWPHLGHSQRTVPGSWLRRRNHDCSLIEGPGRVAAACTLMHCERITSLPFGEMVGSTWPPGDSFLWLSWP